MLGSASGDLLHQIAGRLKAGAHQCFSWGLHTGAELDLLVVRGEQRLGFEVKLTGSPKVTPSMRSSLEVLRLDRLDVLYSGAVVFPLAERIRAVPVQRVWDPRVRFE